MCIAAWIWQAHPVYELLLLLNRDEYHNRPAKPLGWWEWEEDNKKILGGRDELAGGTWLGCTEEGRLAFLTNVREPDRLPDARTRGDLPLRFLKVLYVNMGKILHTCCFACGSSDNLIFICHFVYLKGTKSPLEYAEEIVEEADQYNGFNLILTDLCSKVMVYISNRPKGEPISVQTVPSGLHVISNGKLDAPWPKAQRLGKNFDEFLREHGKKDISLKGMVEELMGDNVKANRDELPDTGVNPEWEFELSSIFIDTDTKLGRYGTRSMAAISVKTNGDSIFYEKHLESSLWKENNVKFHVKKLQHI
uniref:Transport and Golgi organization 2 homolog isoform X1 n=1 Tax=Elaeis guineensis var. tenera TaxID=51953 RepID=A0A6I9R5W9_ELAGV|nr:transport and Golgi organization 2 homolog isoform X1 [Elaeis guineensis]XP_010918264.1 transport and Golgi organization 2 homolog isoform X1 [Elaeis guineensis]XP_010918265.1 transport and Golgi organization 2 homolog isoform X1 [Elaeis guineensis]